MGRTLFLLSSHCYQAAVSNSFLTGVVVCYFPAPTSHLPSPFLPPPLSHSLSLSLSLPLRLSLSLSVCLSLTHTLSLSLLFRGMLAFLASKERLGSQETRYPLL